MAAYTSIPTVASLCSALGSHLAPVAGVRVPDSAVTAVHISELSDPTGYLTGGELLLTTGLTLPKSEIGCRGYAARLKKADISALALGLGPVYRESPVALVNACRTVGVVLLTVPAPTPFLTISRAYWNARSRATEQQLNDAVASHRALVDAAVAPDPAAAILRRLARVIDGWVALLDPRGDIDQAYPPSVDEHIDELRSEVARLQVAGVHSSASFTVGDHVVVVFPLAVENRIVGYLAAGTPRQLEAHQRRVVLTAAALLSIDVLRQQRSESAREATRRCVALLLDSGMVGAARRIAAETDCRPPAREMCVLAVRGRNSEELAQGVEGWCADALAVAVDRSLAWFLLPDDHGDAADLVDRLHSADGSAAVVLSELVAVDSIGATRARTLRVLGELSPGEVVLPRPSSSRDVIRAVEKFSAGAGPDLSAALVAYLRCRGQWEQAAKVLDVHRNTLRYRVAKARDLLGLELHDPDVAAETWLALRARGLA